MQVSFGKKIPIIKAQVQDKKTENFEPVTVYKVDCSDETDTYEIESLPSDWHYRDIVTKNMNEKTRLIRFFESDNDTSFYVAKSKDDKTLGICETQLIDEGIHNINFLETKSPKRFVGQVLLASVGQDIINQKGKQITITDPVDSAIEFYTDICGFEDINGDYLRMTKTQLDQFIEQTEERTEARLIDLRG